MVGTLAHHRKLTTCDMVRWQVAHQKVYRTLAVVNLFTHTPAFNPEAVKK
jgi:hypothetical protein